MVGGKTGQLFGTEQQDHIIMLSIQHRDRAADIALNFLSRHHHQLVITEQGQESFLAVTYGVLGHYLVRRHLAQQADVGDLFFPDMFGQERQYSRQRHNADGQNCHRCTTHIMYLFTTTASTQAFHTQHPPLVSKNQPSRSVAAPRRG